MTEDKKTSLESFEQYEVTEKPSDVELDVAETILAQLMVEAWLKEKAVSKADGKAGQSRPDEGLSGENSSAA